MRIPSFDHFQRFVQAAAFFACGLIVGSAVYSALQNAQVDQLIRENYKLQDELTTLRKEVDQNQQRRKENVIRSIVPFIEEPRGKPPLDIVTEAELKKRLEKDLKIFIGRNIYMIGSDSRIARNLLEQKIYDHIGDKDYEVSVKTMLVVDGVLQVWVEAKIHHPK
ncbi:hypothetical protein [Cohnella silvisoli]|uniref:Sporulation membrane protein YtrI C-terminal domain-containing protein n=1 Tax=Cohnella silvisoli TaxID=2873699 RepID=A0ABV1L1T8_9BACL|nr:hypothetical protein [Cohnella silvisoli]MCD9025946.1 hypothetical protein [Cohnella silvisoli]